MNMQAASEARAGSEARPETSAPRTVGALEQRLLELFPAADAEVWDRTGMLVGDACAPLTKIAVALDPTVAALSQAAAFGANVLVCHHPLFLDPPTSFAPPKQRKDAVGARVWEAIALGISVLSFHTALDVSPRAAQVLPGKLGLQLEGILTPTAHDPVRGYGQICTFKDGGPHTLGDLVARCEQVFSHTARMWGEPARPVRRIVCLTGAAGDELERACDAGIDCVIAGEVRYHRALDACSRGLSVIELGHDISEYPLTEVLVSSMEEIGIDSKTIRVLKRADNWR